MKNSDIPPEVRRFILTSLPSVPHMEALMIMRAAAPVSWTAPQLAQRLYVSPSSARTVLADLHRSRLLALGADMLSYSFEAAAPLVDQLARLYASHLVEITVLIHSKPDRQTQQVADAFKRS